MGELEALAGSLPEYAAELRLNFDALVVRQSRLTPDQLWGTLVACALTARCRALTAAVLADACRAMRPEALYAARTAAAMMTLTNSFYRYEGLRSEAGAHGLRAGLRVSSLRSAQAAGTADFSLWCLAVSVMNGCAACVQAQERTLAQHGVETDLIAAALRLQALVAALAVVVDAESAIGEKPAGS